MAAVVVDASALAAICFDEQEGPLVSALLKNADLFSTPLLDIELANVAWKKLRRSADRSLLIRALEIRNGFPTTVREVDIRQVVELALATGLTAYDASYLWLARHMQAELITLDRRLALAAAGGP